VERESRKAKPNKANFLNGQNGVTSYLKGIYDNKSACGQRENKANSNPILRLRSGLVYN
jgi:hypothetical protein